MYHRDHGVHRVKNTPSLEQWCKAALLGLWLHRGGLSWSNDHSYKEGRRNLKGEAPNRSKGASN